MSKSNSLIVIVKLGGMEKLKITTNYQITPAPSPWLIPILPFHYVSYTLRPEVEIEEVRKEEKQFDIPLKREEIDLEDFATPFSPNYIPSSTPSSPGIQGNQGNHGDQGNHGHQATSPVTSPRANNKIYDNSQQYQEGWELTQILPQGLSLFPAKTAKFHHPTLITPLPPGIQFLCTQITGRPRPPPPR